jgi:hypothetical protein
MRRQLTVLMVLCHDGRGSDHGGLHQRRVCGQHGPNEFAGIRAAIESRAPSRLLQREPANRFSVRPPRDTAEALNCSMGSSRAKAARGVAILRKRLGPHFDVLPKADGEA